ncbi:MAG: hypothetical protein WC536_02570 [Patescibacteria group bacterium]
MGKAVATGRGNEDVVELEQLRLSPVVRDYPEPCFWEEDSERLAHITIVNGNDFPKQNILEGLGIVSGLSSSFGICDPEEIRKRISLMRFFCENPDIREWFSGMRIKFDMPNNEQTFVSFINTGERNPYWSGVHEFLGVMNKTKNKKLMPDELASFLRVLERSAGLEQDEQAMFAAIDKRIQNIAHLEGFVEFGVSQFTSSSWYLVNGKEDGVTHKASLSAMRTACFGYRRYSEAIRNFTSKPYPEWFDQWWNPRRWFANIEVEKKRIDEMNAEARAAVYADQSVLSIPDMLLADIHKAVTDRINSLRLGVRDLAYGCLLVRFSYASGRLRLQIYNLTVGSYSSAPEFQFAKEDVYRGKVAEEMCSNWEHLDQQMNDQILSVASVGIRRKLLKQNKNLFCEFEAPSPQTNEKYQWDSLSTFYRHLAVDAVYTECIKHRRYFSASFAQLGRISSLAERLCDVARELKAPLCYPEIVEEEDDSVVEFDGIYPVALLADLAGKKPVTIKGSISGASQVVGLTGRNTGGKTVTALTIAANIWLAQSGLPVLGRSFRLNVKKTLGMVFLGKDEGSRSDILLGKIKAVLEVACVHKGSEMVVIVDELGEGTQESSGEVFGKRLLATLADKGITTLFTTQILGVAEYAQDYLDAQCYRLDAKHRMWSGIGGGQFEALLKERGIEKLLVQ